MKSRPTLAVFDFDGTITTEDTLLNFIKFSCGKRSFYFGFLLFLPVIIAMKLKCYPNWKTKQHVFSYFYKGVKLEKFNSWGEKFSAEIEKIIRPQAIEKIVFHKKQGDKVVIISASVENWILPWAEKIGVEAVLATKAEVDAHGLLTGRFYTKNCYGQEKVNRLRSAFDNLADYYIIAYGDSPGDKEMIDLADEGYYNKFK